jgi:hypothetical protein
MTHVPKHVILDSKQQLEIVLCWQEYNKYCLQWFTQQNATEYGQPEFTFFTKVSEMMGWIYNLASRNNKCRISVRKPLIQAATSKKTGRQY